MRTWYHSWRAALRIARRDAWRYKGRSFLVLAMIALPILGVSALDLTLRSSELSAAEAVERDLGGADARFSDPEYGGVPVMQTPKADGYQPKGDFDDEPWPDGPTDVKKAIPAGATVLEDAVGSGKLRTTHGLLHAEIRELKATDPMARGIMRLGEGRFPEKSGEVAATTHFLEASGLRIGSKLTARGFDAEYRIVGSYELPSDLKADQVNALPGALLAPLDKALKADDLPGTSSRSTYLVNLAGSGSGSGSGSGGFTWNMVQEINAKGVLVVSRAVVLDPPARADVALYQQDGWGDYEQSDMAQTAELAAIGTVVGLAMLEICLLAGPAFAVGARRSRRQLGLVGANGGDRHHVRAIVLGGGLVIGVASAVVGTVLAIGLTFALQPLLEDYLGKRFGSFDIRPLELGGIALLAVLTGLLAAIVPAITSSRQTVLASLTGRRGVRRSNRVLPIVGLVAVAIGAAIALYGSLMTDQFAIVAAGSALAELGVVALTPALVGLFGRIGRWLPLSPRLALRDSVRNRGRTAPAVAAVLAAVAGTVAVSTYTASSDAQQRAEYVPELPHGAVSVMITEAGGRDVPTVRQAVQQTLPVDVRADVDRVNVGKPSCEMYSDEEGCGQYEVIVPEANQCPLWKEGDGGEDLTTAERRKLGKDWRCKDNEVYSYADYGVLVGDAKVLKVLGIKDPEAGKALAEGKAVSFDKRNVNKDGKIDIRAITDVKAADKAREADEEPPGDIKSFTAHQAPEGTNAYGLSMIITPATAKAAGFGTVPFGAYYSTTSLPTGAQQQKLDGEIDKTGTEVNLRIEKGYSAETGIVLLALTVFAGLITIGAAGIATGLAQADAEADLKTLAAVGAPARVRRTLSGFQCGVVAVMGVLLGSAAGVLPAIGLLLTERRAQETWYQDALDQGLGSTSPPFVPIVVPWATVAALLVAVPLGAALLAALVTRSHRTLGRRAAT
ncbi:ABC transporter permease [Streptomyces sp. JV176]|uniref:ABC transporter permease n=1 Tax=Streptomyces sp. JV176 TaxID=858630 RepID=UPI002E79A3C6|nr:ABC transporter permease [Streptomyces sp. JV176]MEE1803569.1 ABC transporter permease [Streptomyces sp. JV176]